MSAPGWLELAVGAVVAFVGAVLTTVIGGALDYHWPFLPVLLIWAVLVFGGFLIVDDGWFDS